MTTHSAGTKAMTDIGLVALWQLAGLMLFIVALVGLYFIILALGTKDVEIPGGPGLAAFCLCAALAGARLGHRARALHFPLFGSGTAVTILIGDTAVNAFMMQDIGTPDPVTFGSILALYGLASFAVMKLMHRRLYPPARRPPGHALDGMPDQQAPRSDNPNR